MKSKQILLVAVIIFLSYTNAYSQSTKLFEQVHQGLRTDYIASNLEELRPYAENNGSAKKNRVVQLSSATEAFMNECNIAYNNALSVEEQLQNKNISEYNDDIEQVKEYLRAMHYAANSLVEKCNWMYNRPKVHSGKTYNSMINAYNIIVKNRNYLGKKTSALSRIAIMLSY